MPELGVAMHRIASNHITEQQYIEPGKLKMPNACDLCVNKTGNKLYTERTANFQYSA